MNIDFWLYKIYVQLSGDVTAQGGKSADFWAAKIYYSIALGNNNVVPMGRSTEFYLGKFYFYLTGNPASTPYQRNINDWLRVIYLRMRYGTSQPLPTFANDRNAEFWAKLLFELIESGNYYLLPPTITGNAIPFNVTENSPVDTVVGTLSYTNPNATEAPVFTIVSGNTNNTFKINATTGQILVNIPPDYEQTPSYSLIIRITVQNASAQAAMTINITNTIDTYVEYITQTINPVLWMRNRETSGTTATNSGSAGAILNGVIGGTTTLGQTGQLGANEAFLFDGATSRIVIPNDASINALPVYTYIALIKPSSAGELTLGTMFAWNNGTSTNFGNILFFNASLTGLRYSYRNSADTNFETITTGYTILTSQYTMIFVEYDDNGDRKPNLFYGINGAVTEFSYSSNVALTGTVKTQQNSLHIGNRSDFATTFAGLYDEFMIVNRILSSAEKLQIVSLTGV